MRINAMRCNLVATKFQLVTREKFCIHTISPNLSRASFLYPVAINSLLLTRELNSPQPPENHRTFQEREPFGDASDRIRLGNGRDCRVCQINAVAIREDSVPPRFKILYSETIRCNCIIIAAPRFRGFRVSVDRCIALPMLL